jgi:hypothetical protein
MKRSCDYLDMPLQGYSPNKRRKIDAPIPAFKAIGGLDSDFAIFN